MTGFDGDWSNLPSGTSILICPFCGHDIHFVRPDDYRPGEVICDESEVACWAHLRARHRIRYWYWRWRHGFDGDVLDRKWRV